MEYTGLNIVEVYDLDIIEFQLYYRDGYIHKLNQTERGREYLEKCFTLTLTKADNAKLREKFGKG
jgi:hypothetical protein